MKHGVAAIIAACVCACGEPAPSSEPELANGIYEVVASAARRAELPEDGDDTRALLFDRQFLRGGADVPPEHVQLRTAGFAPLDLAEAPETSQANGRPALLLKLKPEAARALTKLTTHARRAAVVIGGKVVTVHGIRVPLEGGAFQVSC